MKWLVLALAVLNLAYLGYWLTAGGQSREQPRDERRDVPQAESIGGLLLLAELEDQPLRLRRPQETPLEAPPSPVEAAEERPAPGDAYTPIVVPSVPPAAVKFEPQCFTVGPLDAGAPALALQRWFDARGLAARLSPRERREVAFQWVFFPPFASRDEAVAKVLEMRERGISDIVVMRKGDMANAISLGAFSGATAVARRVRELNAKGYHPSTTERHFARLAQWMDVAVGQELPEAAFKTTFPALKINARRCERAELEDLRGEDEEP